jgi:nucleosome binding factor SPN SPT16 subunit
LNRSGWGYSVKIYLEDTGGILNWNTRNVTQDRDGWRDLVRASVNFGYQKYGEFLGQLRNYWLVKEKSAVYSYLVRVNRKLISVIRLWTFPQQPWELVAMYLEKACWKKLCKRYQSHCNWSFKHCVQNCWTVVMGAAEAECKLELSVHLRW